ncbi:unnamed protein product [Schistosoma mattheei]|uniref:Uncharacterized protein n=1 Tax=Schistosoma mattheei TaxID=31246 RepID=A0A183P1X5_9TREM|nr:unnamed protein product [Schistosoma mattheei]
MVIKVCEGVDRQSKSSISTTEEGLELKTTANQHQGQNFQYKCQDSSTVWVGNLENYESHHLEDASVWEQLSTQNTSDPLVRHYQQQPTVRENKPDPRGGRSQEEALEVDRTHIEESTQLRHKASSHLESSRPTKEKTKENITPRNGDRHEKNEQKLDGTRKQGPRQSGNSILIYIAIFWFHPTDFISHPKWMSTHKSFTFPKKSRIVQISVHSSSNSLFVAVNNSIIRVSAETFIKKDEASWSLSSQDISTCSEQDSNRKIPCNQYAVTLLKVVDKIFPGLNDSPLHRAGVYVCLSNGLIAECSLRQANNLRAPSKIHWKSVDHCPIDPDRPAVGFVASTQNLYIGTKIGSFKNAEMRIMKINSVENLNSIQPFKYPIRTSPDDRMIKQNNNTIFVHSFEFHNAVYFLFRELADETAESCDKSVSIFFKEK